VAAYREIPGGRIPVGVAREYAGNDGGKKKKKKKQGNKMWSEVVFVGLLAMTYEILTRAPLARKISNARKSCVFFPARQRGWGKMWRNLAKKIGGLGPGGCGKIKQVAQFAIKRENKFTLTILGEGGDEFGSPTGMSKFAYLK